VIFVPTAIVGVFVIDLERNEDERGFFARTWCNTEASGLGIHVEWVQCSISYSRLRGSLRGMHYQRPPHAEGKLVRVTRGTIYDVVIDLRPASPTYKRHVAVTLSDQNGFALYIPADALAHGFLTLADESEVFYQMSTPYVASAAAGVRWDDPAFGIPWPEPVRVISERDARFPDFQPYAG
jgi:dTDP-4-dehydrorhamnose 3,5-epimerase